MSTGTVAPERPSAPAGAPFDAIAPRYDGLFSSSALGLALRRSVHRRIAPLLRPGQRWLDLGCGTGEDAVWLAAQGIQVVGIDRSPAMLALAAAKAREAGFDADQAQFVVADLGANGSLAFLEVSAARGGAPLRFDGALANFGVINCLPQPRALASELGRLLAPDGVFVAVPMGPVCLWEAVDALLTLRPARLVRRLRATSFMTSSGRSALWYPTPASLGAALAPFLRPTGTSRPLGFALPPTDAAGWLRSRPRLVAAAASMDETLANLPALAWLSDHYVTTFALAGSPATGAGGGGTDGHRCVS